MPVSQVPLFRHEMLGVERLKHLSAQLYADGRDPAAVTRLERPYSFHKVADHYEVHLRVPFTEKGEVGLFKKRDELVVEVGTMRRHIGLPVTMAQLEPVRARMESGLLVVELKETA